MLRPSSALRTIVTSRRGRALFAAHALGVFGLLSGAIQLLGQAFPQTAPAQPAITGAALALCLGWGLLKAYPRNVVVQEFRKPDFTVTVLVGDLFDQDDAHLVVGFTDTFDTGGDGDPVISARSVQGQLIDRVYNGSPDALEAELAVGLAGVEPAGREPAGRKPRGKRVRYPVGTVVTLPRSPRKIFAVVYARMGNDLVAESGMDELWAGLSRLWDAIHREGQREPVAMAVVGAGLSRIDVLDRESLLKLILLSYISRCRHKVVCSELRIVVHPEDLDRINMLEVAGFLRGL